MNIFGYSTTRNYAKDGKCIRCPKCGGAEFSNDVLDRIDYSPCEVNIHCADCRALVSYWGYGYYDPCFMFGNKSIPALITRISLKIRGVPAP